MSIDTTENDDEIARILSEPYQLVIIVSIFVNLFFFVWSWESNLFHSDGAKRSNSSSPILSKKLKIDEDDEIAFILQIEEIVLSENGINEKTMK